MDNIPYVVFLSEMHNFNLLMRKQTIGLSKYVHVTKDKKRLEELFQIKCNWRPDNQMQCNVWD